MRASEFIVEVSQYRYWNPKQPPAATTPYDLRQMGQQWREIAKGTQSAPQDPERRYYAGRNPLADPVPMDDPAVADIPDDEALERLEAQIDQRQLQAALKSTMSSLTAREREVLHMRFFQDMTLDQVAKFMGVGRDRIRQIEAKALRRMRHPNRAKILQPFVNPQVSTASPAPAQAPDPETTVTQTGPNLDRPMKNIASLSPDEQENMARFQDTARMRKQGFADGRAGRYSGDVQYSPYRNDQAYLRAYQVGYDEYKRNKRR